MSYRFQQRLRDTYGVSKPTPNKPPVYAAIENHKLPVEYIGGGQGREPVKVEAKPLTFWAGVKLGLCIGMLLGAGAYHLAMIAAVYFKG